MLKNIHTTSVLGLYGHPVTLIHKSIGMASYLSTYKAYHHGGSRASMGFPGRECTVKCKSMLHHIVRSAESKVDCDSNSFTSFSSHVVVSNTRFSHLFQQPATVDLSICQGMSITAINKTRRGRRGILRNLF